MFGEEFLISWNNKFPKDREYRKKYNIAFGSVEHRKLSQIDIFYDSLEDKIFDKYVNKYRTEREGLEEYQKTGKWLKESAIPSKKHDELFDKLDIDQLNEKEE